MRATSEKEIEAVLKLDGPSRMRHFVKRVADSEAAWSLWNDGWALMENNDGALVFPLWPAPEYAELLRCGDWEQYEVREVPLSELLDEVLPKLKERGVLPGVFPTPQGKGVTPTPEELAICIREELEKYA